MTMAERLASFHFKRGGSQAKYPWAEWGVGIWKVKRDEDFKIPTKNFISLLHGHARRVKMRVRTSHDSDVVVFEFYDREAK